MVEGRKEVETVTLDSDLMGGYISKENRATRETTYDPIIRQSTYHG